MDPWSLDKTPSVVEPVQRYVQRLSRVNGAKPTAGKLEAYTFGVDEFPSALTGVIAALETLVADVTGL